MHRFLFLFFIFLPLYVFAQQDTYTVRRGDDFDAIAKRYGITVTELQEANPESKVCYVGRKLVIPKHGVAVERKHVTEKDIDFHLTSNVDKQLPLSAKSSYQVGEALFKSGKIEAARGLLLFAADAGESRAYYPLAQCCASPKASYQDEERAAYYYHMAVDSIPVSSRYADNYANACLELAKRFVSGQGVTRDLVQARKYCSLYRKYAVSKSSAYNNVMTEIQKAENEIAAEKKRQEVEKQKKASLQNKNMAAVVGRGNVSNTIQLQNSSYSMPQSSVPSASTGQRNLSPYTLHLGNSEITYYPQADGTMKVYTKTSCVYCHGTLKCAGCQYTPMIQSCLSYPYVCPLCGGSGHCYKCGGKGYYESVGLVGSTGGGYLMGQDGRITYGAAGYSGGGSFGSSTDISSSSSRKSSSSSNNLNNPVRVRRDAPNYTGKAETEWCDECKSFGIPHYHYNLK